MQPTPGVLGPTVEVEEEGYYHPIFDALCDRHRWKKRMEEQQEEIMSLRGKVSLLQAARQQTARRIVWMEVVLLVCLALIPIYPDAVYFCPVVTLVWIHPPGVDWRFVRRWVSRLRLVRIHRFFVWPTYAP